MDPEREEYELALKARAGDLEAFADLDERTRLRLFPLAHAELRYYDDAHDAIAAALPKVCRHATELRIQAWMNNSLRNECRLRQRREAMSLPAEETNGQTKDDRLSPLRLDIELALQKLPGKEARATAPFLHSGAADPGDRLLPGAVGWSSWKEPSRAGPTRNASAW